MRLLGKKSKVLDPINSRNANDDKQDHRRVVSKDGIMDVLQREEEPASDEADTSCRFTMRSAEKKENISLSDHEKDDDEYSFVKGMRNCDLSNEEIEVFQTSILGSEEGAKKKYPFLHEIKPVEGQEPLGHGRCGKVTMVKYKGKDVAVKEYIGLRQNDDENEDREPFELYLKELSILQQLHKSQGILVPRLLFHIPWPTSPLIGLEAGTPMEDDFDKWTGKDMKDLEELTKRMWDEGFTQGDHRGSNYIRLKPNGNLAMIDFESFITIE